MEDPNPTEDPSPLTAMASSFPLLVYEDQHREPPEDIVVYHQTMLSVADGSTRTLQLPVPALRPSDAVSNPDCLVLLYSFEEPELRFCHVRGGGGGGGGGPWVTQSYDIGLYEIPGLQLAPERRHINNMAAVKGKFYFLESPNVMGVFSFDHSPEPHLELSTFAATMPRFICDDPHVATLSYLLESCQELFLVCLFYPGCTFERLEEVGAYRMDFSKQEWCKVTDIGDRVFFLGPDNFAASCSATECGLEKGLVYFAFDFLGDSNDFHIFDLEEDARELVSPTQADIPPVLTRKPFGWFP
nr:unnamed protein product [Digitaria exilis]